MVVKYRSLSPRTFPKGVDHLIFDGGGGGGCANPPPKKKRADVDG